MAVVAVLCWAGASGHPGAYPFPGTGSSDTKDGGDWLRAASESPVTDPLSWGKGKGTTLGSR